jgi:predicted nuclease with RNAse H fold
MLTGVIVGYDPGGNGAHGVAKLSIRGGQPEFLETITLKTAEDVISYLEDLSTIVAIGVDTLTCWSTGLGAWRPADRWLRNHYVNVRNRIVAPNGLFGAMSLNGMAVLVAARLQFPGIPITETHPKVLYWHLSNQEYDYTSSKVAMDKTLAHALGIDVAPATEHEWDAALSTLAALKGVSGWWTLDLHSLPNVIGERIVSPCGRTNYYWPET